MHGMLQIAEALSYLHCTERMVHMNVSPHSILITKRGMWKLAGLGFVEGPSNGNLQVFAARHLISLQKCTGACGWCQCLLLLLLNFCVKVTPVDDIHINVLVAVVLIKEEP